MTAFSVGLSQVLEEVSVYAPNKEAHSQLCLLLTTPQLHQHKHFKNWNPSSARVECWNEVTKSFCSYIVEDFIINNTTKAVANNHLEFLIFLIKVFNPLHWIIFNYKSYWNIIHIHHIVEDCFTPWLIHGEGEFIFSIFKEIYFSISKLSNC